MPKYSVGQSVVWDGDNQTYTVTAVHNGSNVTTYDIVSAGGVAHHNISEGALRPTTG